MAEADKKVTVLECPGGGKATTLGNLLYKVWHWIEFTITLTC
jgi:hypothetical protein